MCKQPLHFLGGVGFKSGWDLPINPFYHQYLLVFDKNGKMTTGGQDRADGAFGKGKPSVGDGDDTNNLQCKSIPDLKDDDCVEQCIITKIKSPRPDYALFLGDLFGGKNCQGWADDTLEGCIASCK